MEENSVENVAAAELRQFIERIERLEEESILQTYMAALGME